jgi:hypothetical protein
MVSRSVCHASPENINQNREHSNARTVRPIILPTSQHNQYANSVLMGNHQSAVVLAAFHVHLEKQARRVRRAKLESTAQQKMN